LISQFLAKNLLLKEFNSELISLTIQVFLGSIRWLIELQQFPVDAANDTQYTTLRTRVLQSWDKVSLCNALLSCWMANTSNVSSQITKEIQFDEEVFFQALTMIARLDSIAQLSILRSFSSVLSLNQELSPQNVDVNTMAVETQKRKFNKISKACCEFVISICEMSLLPTPKHKHLEAAVEIAIFLTIEVVTKNNDCLLFCFPLLERLWEDSSSSPIFHANKHLSSLFIAFLTKSDLLENSLMCQRFLSKIASQVMHSMTGDMKQTVLKLLESHMKASVDTIHSATTLTVVDCGASNLLQIFHLVQLCVTGDLRKYFIERNKSWLITLISDFTHNELLKQCTEAVELMAVANRFLLV